jgi:hypothetical protein
MIQWDGACVLVSEFKRKVGYKISAIEHLFETGENSLLFLSASGGFSVDIIKNCHHPNDESLIIA